MKEHTTVETQQRPDMRSWPITELHISAWSHQNCACLYLFLSNYPTSPSPLTLLHRLWSLGVCCSFPVTEEVPHPAAWLLIGSGFDQHWLLDGGIGTWTGRRGQDTGTDARESETKQDLRPNLWGSELQEVRTETHSGDCHFVPSLQDSFFFSFLCNFCTHGNQFLALSPSWSGHSQSLYQCLPSQWRWTGLGGLCQGQQPTSFSPFFVGLFSNNNWDTLAADTDSLGLDGCSSLLILQTLKLFFCNRHWTWSACQICG